MPAAVLVLAELAALFFAVVGYLAARGTLAIWEHSIGGLLQWMHDHLNIRVPLPHFGSITIPMGRPFGAANNYMVHLLQDAAAQSERSMGIFLHGLGALWTWTLSTIEDAMHDGVRWARWTQDVLIPRTITSRVAPVDRKATAAKAQAEAAMKATAGMARGGAVDTQSGARVTYKLPQAVLARLATDEQNIGQLQRAVAATSGSIALQHPGAIARPWPRLGSLERWRPHVNLRLRNLEKGIVGAALLGAIARAIGLGSARCLREGNVGRAMRRWCGLDRLIVDALLLDLGLNLTHLSLVDFAKATQRAAPLVAASMVGLVDEIPIAADEAKAMGERALKVLESIA